MHSRHPLRKKLKHGPKGPNVVDSGVEALNDANDIIDALEKGVLEPLRHSTPAFGHNGKYRALYARLGPDFGKVGRILTAEQEQALGFRVQTYGDLDARNLLVEKNMGLVRKMVAYYARRNPDATRDYIHEGALGLIRAAELFDPTRKLRFITFASHWIRAKIGRLRFKMSQQDTPFANDGGQIFDVDPFEIRRLEVATQQEVNLQEAVRLGHLKPTRRRVTIDQLTFTDAEGSEHEHPDVLDTHKTVEENIIEREDKELVLRLVEGLKNNPPKGLTAHSRELWASRAQLVVEKRLMADEPMTLLELSQLMNVSREYVRIVEVQVKRQLKQMLLSGNHMSPRDRATRDACDALALPEMRDHSGCDGHSVNLSKEAEDTVLRRNDMRTKNEGFIPRPCQK